MRITYHHPNLRTHTCRMFHTRAVKEVSASRASAIASRLAASSTGPEDYLPEIAVNWGKKVSVTNITTHQLKSPLRSKSSDNTREVTRCFDFQMIHPSVPRRASKETRHVSSRKKPSLRRSDATRRDPTIVYFFLRHSTD